MGNHKNGSTLLSLVLPVYNCSEAIGVTLESIKQQNYAPLEVIVVDARSSDRTLEIVNSYSPLISRIYTVTDDHLADMINRGISLSTGEYVTLLYPGSYYISSFTFQIFANAISEKNRPDLCYSGAIQREIKGDPQTILFPFEYRFLQKGYSIAALPACWFRHDLFAKIGKFNTRYASRFSFDFFCRIAKEKGLEITAIDRILVDIDYGRFSYGKAFHFALDTWRILCHHFGLARAFWQFFTKNHLLLFKWFWHRFKLHLAKK